jgi:putative Mg2+ transporter-C (MgtC) family protein
MIETLFLLKMLVVFVMTFLFGLERQLEHKPVGFGVYSFVGCSSCALTCVALAFSPTTLMPLLGAIVTGVGFLGAGAIFRSAEGISGIISASALWTFAIMGIIVGYGDFVVASILYCIIWIILGINRLFEFRSFGYYQKTLVLRTRRYLTKDDLREVFGMKGLFGFTIKYNKQENEFRCTSTLTGRPSELNALPPRLLADPDIIEFSIE